MPFGQLTLNGATYDPRKDGTYILSTVTFPNPARMLVLSPVSVLKSGDTRLSIAYIHEKDVATPSGAIIRKSMNYRTLIDFSVDFTPAEIDAAGTCVSDFLTAATASRMVQGEI